MKELMPVSDEQLRAMTRDLEQLHNDTLPSFRSHLVALSDELREATASRRAFLRGSAVVTGAAGAAALLAGCGDAASVGSTAPSAAANGTDLQVARLAASLEVLAVNTYAAALTATGAGGPLAGAVPAAVVQFATTAQLQHQDHANAWNSTLEAAGQAPQTDPDPRLNSQVQAALGQVKTTADVAKLALMLEDVSLQTYVSGSTQVSSAVARQLALTIAPVEAQHAAILSFVLGQYPVPDTFTPLTLARTTSDLG